MLYAKDTFLVTLTVTTEKLSDASRIKVYSKKPGSNGFRESEPTSVDYEANKIVYKIDDSENLVVGDWVIYARVWNGDEEPATTTPVIINVKQAGTK